MLSMKQKSTVKRFGKRLADLRKERGLTQTQLGEKVGVSYRVIAYYETESEHPPAHLIAPLSKALRVSSDELLGLKDYKQYLNPEHFKLWKKLQKIEALPKKDQKALIEHLEALIAKNK